MRIISYVLTQRGMANPTDDTQNGELRASILRCRMKESVQSQYITKNAALLQRTVCPLCEHTAGT